MTRMPRKRFPTLLVAMLTLTVGMAGCIALDSIPGIGPADGNGTDGDGSDRAWTPWADEYCKWWRANETFDLEGQVHSPQNGTDCAHWANFMAFDKGKKEINFRAQTTTRSAGNISLRIIDGHEETYFEGRLEGGDVACNDGKLGWTGNWTLFITWEEYVGHFRIMLSNKTIHPCPG